MKYRIEYTDGRRCSFVTGRKAVIQLLKGLSAEIVADVCRIYKSGVSMTVMESYERFLQKRARISDKNR